MEHSHYSDGGHQQTRSLFPLRSAEWMSLVELVDLGTYISDSAMISMFYYFYFIIRGRIFFICRMTKLPIVGITVIIAFMSVFKP